MASTGCSSRPRHRSRPETAGFQDAGKVPAHVLAAQAAGYNRIVQDELARRHGPEVAEKLAKGEEP